MLSVSPEIYKVIIQASRYLFAFFALMLLFFAVSWLYGERRKRRDRLRSLPEAGHIGEMIVISGSDELPADTWFPIPREGVLGSLRSCDLVVPCPGVRARHLAFSWQDGTGLVIRPFPGSETFVDGVPLLTADKADRPVMVHGSCLQVGNAVLRLQLLAALEHTNRPFTLPVPSAEYTGAFAPPAPSEAYPGAAAPQPYPSLPQETVLPLTDPEPENEYRIQSASPSAPPAAPAAPRRKRADRWKEDFSE